MSLIYKNFTYYGLIHNYYLYIYVLLNETIYYSYISYIFIYIYVPAQNGSAFGSLIIL